MIDDTVRAYLSRVMDSVEFQKAEEEVKRLTAADIRSGKGLAEMAIDLAFEKGVTETFETLRKLIIPPSQHGPLSIRKITR